MANAFMVSGLTKTYQDFSCAVWHGGDPGCLDGAQTEKAVIGRADAGDRVKNCIPK